MNARKPRVTRTINPLQFEALEPHRFEDLVRRLLYGFREWVDIEPTGRLGGDDGFDVRAWERVTDNVTNTGEDGEAGERTVEGRLWQVQGKREKSLGPKDIKRIISLDVNAASPPHGFILAAATNISKTSYDTYRTMLRERGVREMYFWGKDYLEDQLARPENDEILFTFFGISLSPRRKSRASEVKFGINNKNKILRLLFEKDTPIDQSITGDKTMLLRDINDTAYPDEGQGSKIEQRHWAEHDAMHVSPSGVYFKYRDFYAFVDQATKEWDYCSFVDLTVRRHPIDVANARRNQEEGQAVEHYCRHFPREVQAKLIVYGYVAFDDMLIIDERGDPEYPQPHIFLEFNERTGLFRGTVANVRLGGESYSVAAIEAAFKRVRRFPERFPPPKEANRRSATSFTLPPDMARRLKWQKTLYFV